jgi:hypothetical protein
MAQAGDAMIGTAEETLAHLREGAGSGLAIQMSFPNAGYDAYFVYFPDCGHYLVRVCDLGADPSDVSHILIQQGELSAEDVIYRMNDLMQRDIDADPQDAQLRMELERLMVDEG